MRARPFWQRIPVFLAACALAGVADAKPARRGRIVCRPAAGVVSGQLTKLTVNYALTPVQVVGSDLQATVDGTYELATNDGRRKGTLAGLMTPKVWYGGSFDVRLAQATPDGADARLLVARNVATATLSAGPTRTELDCSGLP
jgi:hypothetical protein